MNLTVENVLFSKRKAEVKRIYFEAFPKKERMPFPMMLAMTLMPTTEFLAFYDGDVLCGFIYQASLFRQTFVMFFAVDESLRSKGYGGKILDIIQARKPKNKIMVSIEPCNASAENLETRKRRKSFYHRCGYTDSGYFIKLGGVWQELLIKNGAFKVWQFLLFFIFYSFGAAIPRVCKIKNN